jgi:hypothetical protein
MGSMAYESLIKFCCMYTRKNEVHHREPTPDGQLLGSPCPSWTLQTTESFQASERLGQEGVKQQWSVDILHVLERYGIWREILVVGLRDSPFALRSDE